jgi:hypothetical protein
MQDRLVRAGMSSENYMSVTYLLARPCGVRVNHSTCRKARYSAASGLLICAALIALSLPIRAHAQFTGKATATGQFESNSNVFDLNSGFAQPGTNGSRRSDTFFAYGAQFDANYLWGRQQFHASASTTEYHYQRFTELDHNAYNLDAGLNWKLGELLDGKLDVSRTHSMVPFYDLTGSTSLSLITEQKETAQIGLMLGSEWKLEGSAYASKSDQPVPNAPNLQLTQTSGTASIEYLGIGNLTSGLTAGYLSGDYSGSNANLNPSYSQSTAGFIANYKHYRTTFDGQIGYSRRVSANGSDNTSGWTGLLDLVHQLTPKTSYTLKIDRTINSYFLNSGSEIDTEAAVTVDWQATYRLGASLGYSFTYRNFPLQGNNPVGSDRVDIQEFANMGFNYRPQRWLMFRPYANVLTRRSTFIGGHYSSTILGVSVTVTPYGAK